MLRKELKRHIDGSARHNAEVLFARREVKALLFWRSHPDRNKRIASICGRHHPLLAGFFYGSFSRFLRGDRRGSGRYEVYSGAKTSRTFRVHVSLLRFGNLSHCYTRWFTAPARISHPGLAARVLAANIGLLLVGFGRARVD